MFLYLFCYSFYSFVLRFNFILLFFLSSQNIEIFNTDSFFNILDRTDVVKKRHVDITKIIIFRSSLRYCLNSECK